MHRMRAGKGAGWASTGVTRTETWAGWGVLWDTRAGDQTQRSRGRSCEEDTSCEVTSPRQLHSQGHQGGDDSTAPRALWPHGRGSRE